MSNYLVTSGATILFVFRLRLFLHLLFPDPLMTKAYFLNTFLNFLSVISVFKRCANYNQLPKYSETLRRKINLFMAFRQQSAGKKLVDCELPGRGCSNVGQRYPPDKSLSSGEVLRETYCVIRWIEIYPVDSAMQCLNNRNLVSSRFLTRGDARAYHELLQGRGYANESLAHSQQTDFVINRVRTRECEDLSFPKKHALAEVRLYQNLCRERASFASAQTQSFLCGKFSTVRLEVLPNLRHGEVFQMSTMVNLGIRF